MTDKPDMCAALRKWADRLQAEGNAIGESLAAYADAWEAERAASAEEARKLRTVMVAAADEAAADIILHADALIALLQPFASEPEPEVSPKYRGFEMALAELEQDADGWIENTGTQPVGKRTMVDLRLKYGGEMTGVGDPEEWSWNVSEDDFSITHWRLHKPQESKA